MEPPINSAETLAAFIQVRARYRRAMNLERDTGRNDALTGYLVTPVARRALSRIAAGIDARGVERAWTLTGPYGSGKTAFAVFLANLVATRKTPQTRVAHALLKASDAALSQVTRKISMLPVMLTGERAPLDVLLARALRTALTAEWSTTRGAKPRVVAEALRLATRLSQSRKECAMSDVVACFEAAIRAVSETKGAGLLLIVDEAGKIFEYAAQNPTRGDINLFQALAELAAASRHAPFVFVTVLHQAFEEYAARLSASQRNEWAKVQGRFSDLVFQEEPEQLVRLIGAALAPIHARPPLPFWDQLVGTVSAWVSQGTGWDRKALVKHLNDCWPLHPMTAVLLGPLFRGRLAQNERSLFAFLSSGEPLGFHEFLRREGADALYTPNRLYDYVLAALGHNIFGREGKLWAEIDAALRRLPPDADVVDAKILKVAGILTMLGDYVGLRPSAPVLASALVDEAEVPGAIERLQTSSQLIYRKFRDAYQLWEGSDLDVEQLISEAVGQFSLQQSFAPLLMRLTAPRPVIARRHLFDTGTMRYFEVRFVDGEELLSRGVLPFADECLKAGADGVLCLSLSVANDSRLDLRNRLSSRALFGDTPPDAPIVIAVPPSTLYLSELAAELAAVEHVQAHTPALQTDVIARKELASRASEVRQLLEQEVARLFAAENPDCEWYDRDGLLPVRSSRELMAALSNLFDFAYQDAPAIKNELLNRREVSSAAAKARRNLLEAMIQHRDKYRLGFSGYPPEVSMYRSVLEDQRLHREVDGKWQFVEPDSGKRGFWSAIDHFFDDTERQRRPIAELYERLRRPPFGIKEGPLPVLMCAALLSRESEVALYEQGSLIPDLDAATIERLVRSPERFEVRQSKLTGIRLEVFERLARSLLSGVPPSKTVLDIVRRLVRFFTALPNYARYTGTLAPETIQVREALLRAREPAQLLFQDLPRACGVPSFEIDSVVVDGAIDKFFATLRKSLSELQGAYPHLLVQIQALLSQSLGLPSSGADLRKEFRARANRVLPLAFEARLKGFVVRAIDEGLEDEEWVVSLATFVASKQPADWTDRDHDQFQVQLALLARRFRTLEVMAVAEAEPDDGSKFLRISVAQKGGIEQERIVAVRDDDMQLLAMLRERLMGTIQEVSLEVSRDTVVAALALVTERLLLETEGEYVASLEKSRE